MLMKLTTGQQLQQSSMPTTPETGIRSVREHSNNTSHFFDRFYTLSLTNVTFNDIMPYEAFCGVVSFKCHMTLWLTLSRNIRMTPKS